MHVARSISLTERAFYRLGTLLFVGGFLVLSALTLFLIWQMPDVLPLVPVAFLCLLAGWYCFQKPLINLSLVLAGFVLVAGFEEGLQLTEVVYGLYFLAFLGIWFFRRLFMDPRPVFREREDRTLFLFLILMTASLAVTVLFGGRLGDARGEWLSLVFLALYFPVREAVAKSRLGLHLVVGLIAFIGLFVFIRNLLNYQEVLLGATLAHEVAKGRAVTNEGLLLVPAIFSLLFFLLREEWKIRVPALGLFLLFFGGVILTQSRGYWVAFLVGMVVLLIALPMRYRIRLVSAGVLSASLLLGLAVLLLGDLVLLIASGMVDRLISLGSAATSDLSLVNRFHESKVVLAEIVKNPVLGYGMGVNYDAYDMIADLTFTKSFVHNGYLSLLYKFGLWGFGMMMTFLVLIVRRSFVAYRLAPEYSTYKICALAVVISLAALSVSALTSNPFYVNDLMFIDGLLAGIAGGCYMRANRVRKRPARSR